MKKFLLHLGSVSLLILALVIPAGAGAAALIDIGVGTGTNISPTAESYVGVGTDADLDVQADDEVVNSISDDSNIDIRTTIDRNASVTIEEDKPIRMIRNEMDLDVGVQTDANIDNGSTSTSGGVDVNTDILGSEEEVNVSEVNTTSDLEVFAASLMRSDENVEGVVFNHDSVEVNYREPGKFLGFIPVTISIRAVASADGTVDLRFPWYAFLVAADKEELKAQLEAAVKDSIEGSAMAGVNTEGGASLTAPEAARIAQEMQTVLEARYDARYMDENSDTIEE